MEVILWALVFFVSLALVIKGADWFLDSAEKIGVVVGLSPFLIGVLIVGLGTSLPELASAFAALIQGVDEIVAANVVGSNIANILLIAGLSAAVGGKLAVSKDLIDLDIPILTIATALSVFLLIDGTLTPVEALFLIASFAVFLLYSMRNGDTTGDSYEIRQLFSFNRKWPKIEITDFADDPKVQGKKKLAVRDIVWLVVGLAALVVGGRYLVESVVQQAALFNIGVGAISLVAVSVGTSLPELAVSLKAALQGRHEVALGNIFGSNAFNLLLVLGLPGLFATLTVDDATLTLGIPVMVVATLFFVISGISRRIHSYEGALYLLVYAFFIGKLFGLL